MLALFLRVNLNQRLRPRFLTTIRVLSHLNLVKLWTRWFLNVPVCEEIVPYLTQRNHMFVIGTDKKHIHEAFRIPLMHVNNLLNSEVGEWK